MKSKLSKALVLLLAIAMVATQVLVPVYAVDSYECTCPGKTVDATELIHKTVASCTTQGSETYLCATCGGVYVVFTDDKLPHTPDRPVEENRVEADCENAGSYDSVTYCVDCGTEIDRIANTIPALGHDYKDIAAKDATCTEGGWTAYQECNTCGYKTAHDVLDAKGHTPKAPVEENRVEAVCGVAGSYDSVVYCDVCGAEISRTTIVIDALTHDWEETGRSGEDNCKVDDVVNYECLLCGETRSDVTPGFEHDYDKVVVQPYPCLDGTITYTCKVCGWIINDVAHATDAHTPKAPVEENRVEADCVNDGSYDTVVYCDVCGIEISRETTVIPALGHRLENAPGKKPTCTEDGWTAYQECTRPGCGYVTPNAILPALGHDTTPNVVAPTCVAEGYTEDVCSRCDYVSAPYDVTRINPLNHNIDVLKDPVAATCTTTGLTHEIGCTLCGHVVVPAEVVPVNPDNHRLENVVAKDATCTEEGWTAHQECTREGCGYKSVHSILPALGHQLENAPGKAPTCTEDGWTAYQECARCDYVTPNAILPATGHETVITIGKYDPTCLTDGYTVEQCTTCLETFRSNIIPAFNHKDAVSTPAKDPTCTDIGWKAYVTCPCGYTTYEEIPALGHTEGAPVEENRVEPDCTTAGSYDTVVYCDVCDEELSRVTTVLDALGHRLENAPGKKPTCTEDGWTPYQECARCDYVSPNAILPALGHTEGAPVEENRVEPDCVNKGSYDSVVYCDVCGEELSRTTVEIDALGHTAGTAVVENIVPATYDDKGSYDEAVYCTVCGEELDRNTFEVPVLDEEIEFSYNAYGINNSDVAVNSGYIWVDVFMDVKSDIARLHGLSFGLSFDSALTLQEVEMVENFDVYNHTDIFDANMMDAIYLNTNAGIASDVTLNKGQYKVATLKFKVDEYFYAQTVSFDYIVDSGAATHVGYANELFVNFDASTAINVVMLGNAYDTDYVINATDAKAFVDWYLESDIDDYIAKFDMDKNGVIDGDDYDYINKAIVKDFSYLYVG